MAKLIVAIDIPDMSKDALVAYMEKHKGDYFPMEDKTLVSVDHASLRTDPTDDSFYLFKLVEVVD